MAGICIILRQEESPELLAALGAEGITGWQVAVHLGHWASQPSAQASVS